MREINMKKAEELANEKGNLNLQVNNYILNSIKCDILFRKFNRKISNSFTFYINNYFNKLVVTNI